MYTLLNNIEASKLDLYLPGRLVASLHYTIEHEDMHFVYCESAAGQDAEVHRRAVIYRALQEAKARRLRVIPDCAIARRIINEGLVPADTSELQQIRETPEAV